MLPEHGAMVVQDRASRVDAGLFEQLWHLVPGARVVSQTRSTVVARHPSGKADIHVVQVPLPGQELPRGAMTVVSGATDPYLGWYSDGPDKRVAAPVVRARRYGTQARMVTVVAATPVGGSVGASVVESVGGVQLRLAIGGRVADVGLSRYGDMRLGAAAIGSVAPPAGATVLHGDWNGDGADERGWFHEGTFGLDPGDGGDTFVIDYGLPGDKPVVGDWDGDGVDTVGIVRGNLWVLRSEYKRGADDVVMRYGEPTDDPVVGDWDGDGVDTLGVRRGNLWVLRSEYKRGADDVVMRYGEPTDTPVVGDYDGDGDDTLGIRRGRLWVLRDEYRRNAEDRVFTW